MRTRGLCRPEGGQSIVAVLLEAVEEVLGVVDDLLEVLEEIDDGVADHGDVLVEGGPERVGDVKVP